jgi:putative SOS response-associated peptidase YedK
MCYSALIRANLKRLGSEFGAQPDLEEFLKLYGMRDLHPELKIPVGLDRYFMLSPEPAEKAIGALAQKFHEDEKVRARTQIAATEEEMFELSSGKQTAAVKKKIEVRERKRERLLAKLSFSFDRITPLDERIFPGYFAPVIAADGEKRLLLPMRYRVRRPDGGEVPSQYNVFNARRDSLSKAATWRPLFGKRHAIFPFVKFFEWVEREGAKREISFTPESRASMWAASLYTNTNREGALSYRSFAMVTDDPPPEVASAGHDRCPIFLEKSRLDAWLHPQEKSAEFLLALLDHKEKTLYLNDLVA